AGLRRGEGTTAPGSGAGRLTFLPSPSSTDVDGALLTWRVLSIPSSVLAVFDVSASMDFDAPGGVRRIDVAVDAATTALAVFPDHARIGLWEFSTQRGPGGRDWAVLEPIRRLDSVVGGKTQRERLGQRAEEMKDSTDGGTGLYDTALAAYRYAVQKYDENYSNSVILLTDGSNDDPGSISARMLLHRLRALADPQRPVRIIGVAVSEDADLAEIQRIAAATGGSAYRADTSEDLLRVFAQEIAGR
ncbi:MAG TPA: VWA domain-containing protein, partial [Nocardioides sp.]|nr:VWA domain-containing protein [Nocardioides sp.]